MATNIITAAFSSSTITYTKPAYQYDYGMILKFSGINLPQAYEVHFSNTEFCGESISQIGDETGVTIPDEMFLNGNPIYAWTYLHTGEDDGETVYKAVIGVNKRAKPSDLEPTPVQQDAITQAIAALNVAVEQTAADVVTSGENAQAAQDAADVAIEARDQAIDAKREAEDAQEAAETAEGHAQEYAQTATDKASEASGYVDDARRYSESASSFASDAQASSEASYLSAQSSGQYASDASGYASSAYESAQSASGSASDASSAKDGAVQAKSDAISAKNDAVQAKNDSVSAKNDAVSAKNDAVQAKNDAVSAKESAEGFASDASNSADSAQDYANDAQTSAEQAQESAEYVEGALIDKADVITSSASGEIVTIADGGNNMPVVDLSLSLLPVQDLHGQFTPYPPGGGINMLPNQDGSYFEKGSGNLNIVSQMTLSAGTYYIGSYKQETELASIGIYLKVGTASASRLGSNEGQKNIARSFTLEEESTIGLYISSSSATGKHYRFVLSKSVLTNGVDEFAPYSNLCPISGWTGVKINKDDSIVFPPDTAIGQGTINGNTGAIAPSNVRIRSTYFPIQPNTKYTAYSNLPYIGARFFSSNEQSGIISDDSIDSTADSITFTTGSTTKYARLIFAKALPASGSGSVAVAPSDLEYANIISERGKIIPIDWQSTAGTVYGCNIDPISGVLTVDTAKVVLDGTQSGIATNWQAKTNSVGWLYPYSLTPGIKLPYYNTDPVEIISDRLKTLTYQYIYNGTEDVGISAVTSTGGTPVWGLACRVNDTTLTTATAVNAWLAQNPITVVYKLTQAVEYQLSETQIATFLGVNNFWSNGNGTLDLEYRCDTKLYIEQLTKPTEDDMTANQNITSGSFFMVGNRLFLSTVAIAQGATIIPGTNCTEISLADALNSLNS